MKNNHVSMKDNKKYYASIKNGYIDKVYVGNTPKKPGYIDVTKERNKGLQTIGMPVDSTSNKIITPDHPMKKWDKDKKNYYLPDNTRKAMINVFANRKVNFRKYDDKKLLEGLALVNFLNLDDKVKWEFEDETIKDISIKDLKEHLKDYYSNLIEKEKEREKIIEKLSKASDNALIDDFDKINRRKE